MDSSRDFKQSRTCRYGLLYKSVRKPPQKREILIVQVEFGKISRIEGKIMFSEKLNGKSQINSKIVGQEP